jgi:hypothetical protein
VLFREVMMRRGRQTTERVVELRVLIFGDVMGRVLLRWRWIIIRGRLVLILIVWNNWGRSIVCVYFSLDFNTCTNISVAYVLQTAPVG